jgi:hypothetical protein
MPSETAAVCDTFAHRKLKEPSSTQRNMIYQALNCVTRELNEFLASRFSLHGKSGAALNTILNQDGTIPEHNLNKIILSLINMEHETNVRYNPVHKLNEDKSMASIMDNPPYNFNLDVLITAVFESTNYDEGLKFLSESISFFQRKNSFTPDNTPGMEKGLLELNFELIKLSYHQEHSLWGALGAKYMPSVLFKIRLLSFQSGVHSEVPTITHNGPGIGHSSITNLK